MLIVILILFILLAGYTFYEGFISKEDPFANVPSKLRFLIPVSKTKTKAYFTFSLLMIGFILYVMFQQAKTPSKLAEYITPYPNIKKVVWLPNVTDDKVANRITIQKLTTSKNMWWLKTEDSLGAVLNFYLDENNKNGWELKTDPSLLERQAFIHLKKEDKCLDIWIILGNEKYINTDLIFTDIIYTLKDKC